MNYDIYRKTVLDSLPSKGLAFAGPTKRKALQDFSRNNSIIISTRVNGKVTSLKIRTSVSALYCLIMGQGAKTPSDYKAFIMDTVYKICQDWYGEDGKGLSGYVNDRLLRDCLDKEEASVYDFIVSSLYDEFSKTGHIAK